MRRVLERCAALDVHKKQLTACARILGQGGELEELTAEFSTMAADLLALRDWLTELAVTHVAMEATGVYWKPVYYALEDDFELLLVNAQHVKNVPGRKTDTSDAQWLCQLLECGLLRPSFVPPKPIRELRDLTRYRKALIKERQQEANRLHKVLEDAGIKLASLASEEVERRLAPFAHKAENLATISGVAERVAQVILAELGPDRSRFASDR